MFVDDLNKSQRILTQASRLLKAQYDIDNSTIQIELYSIDMEDCDHCQDPVEH